MYKSWHEPAFWIVCGALAAFLLLWIGVKECHAEESHGMSPMPIGYANFCRRDHVDLCSGLKPNAPTEVPLGVLARVNISVNAMPYKEDGGKDLWTIGGAAGDCDDFAVTKMYRLMTEYRVPREALRLALTKVWAGRMGQRWHVVLLVDTSNAGTWVLDCLKSAITRLDERPDLAFVAVEKISPQGFTGLWKWEK